MAELGETTDPKELVQGDASALRGTAGQLGQFGDLLAQVGDGLKEIDDGGWTGQAADAFRNAFDEEPGRWITCGDCFLSARDAVRGYADTLEWAQQEASAAIKLWERGERATAEASAQHQRDEQSQQDGAPAPEREPFDDPGDSLRERARQQLAAARDQLGSAGNDAAGAVDRAQGPAPEERGWLESAVDGVTDAIGDGLRAVGEGIADGLRAVGDGVDDVLDAVGDGVDAVLDGVGGAVDATLDGVGGAVGGVLEGVGNVTGIDGISDAGKSVRGALDDAGDTTRTALDEAGDEVNDATDAAGDAVSEGTDDAGDAVEDGADDAGDTVDPDEDDDGVPEDDGENGGEDPDRDDPDGGDGGDGDNDEVDRDGHWDDANGDKPDPNEITAEGRRSHILTGDQYGGGHKHDSGVPDKTTFPENWDDDKIMDEVEDVAKNPDSPPEYNERSGTWTVRGTRDGVDIEVIVSPDGQIKTGYPTGGEGVHRNDENGDPQPIN